jgi:hypothetical protein
VVLSVVKVTVKVAADTGSGTDSDIIAGRNTAKATMTNLIQRIWPKSIIPNFSDCVYYIIHLGDEQYRKVLKPNKALESAASIDVNFVPKLATICKLLQAAGSGGWI